jgi:hypothetical protein
MGVEWCGIYGPGKAEARTKRDSPPRHNEHREDRKSGAASLCVYGLAIPQSPGENGEKTVAVGPVFSLLPLDL